MNKYIAQLIMLLSIPTIMFGQLVPKYNAVTTDCSKITGNYSDFRWKWAGYDSQTNAFWILDRGATNDLSATTIAFKMVRLTETGNVTYVNWTDTTTVTNRITFTIPYTNVPPNGDYMCEIWSTATTGVSRTLSQGRITVFESLYRDNDATFPWASEGNMTAYTLTTTFDAHATNVGVNVHGLGSASTNESDDFYLASNPSGYISTFTESDPSSLHINGDNAMTANLPMGGNSMTNVNKVTASVSTSALTALDGKDSVLWSQRVLADTNDTFSIEWQAREMYDVGGLLSINWGGRQLAGSWDVINNADEDTEIVNYQTMTNHTSAYLPLAGGTLTGAVSGVSGTDQDNLVTYSQLQEAVNTLNQFYFSGDKTTAYTNHIIPTNNTYFLNDNITNAYAVITNTVTATNVYFFASIYTNATFLELGAQVAEVRVWASEHSAGTAFVKPEFYMYNPANGDLVDISESSVGREISGTSPLEYRMTVPMTMFATNANCYGVCRFKTTSQGASNHDVRFYFGQGYASHIDLTLPIDVVTADLLKLDGSRAMTGNLPMGGNSITNINQLVVTNPAVIVFAETASDNVGIESETYPVTGQVNSVWMGYQALYNSPGNNNSAHGSYALVQSPGNGNSAQGFAALFQSPGNYNSAQGNAALYNSPGSYNSAQGYATLYQSPGSQNSAQGYSALFQSPGSYNSAQGMNALRESAGDYNSAQGMNALSYSAGNGNSAHGSYALNSSAGNNNSAQGNAALYNSPGSYNSAQGMNALRESAGDYNSAVGYQAGIRSAGQTNLFLGANSGATLATTVTNTYTNCITIGGNVLAKGSDTVALGLPSHTTYIDGALVVSNTVTVPAVAYNVSGITNFSMKPVYYTLNTTNYYGMEYTVQTNSNGAMATSRYPIVTL